MFPRRPHLGKVTATAFSERGGRLTFFTSSIDGAINSGSSTTLPPRRGPCGRCGPFPTRTAESSRWTYPTRPAAWSRPLRPGPMSERIRRSAGGTSTTCRPTARPSRASSPTGFRVKSAVLRSIDLHPSPRGSVAVGYDWLAADERERAFRVDRATPSSPISDVLLRQRGDLSSASYIRGGDELLLAGGDGATRLLLNGKAPTKVMDYRPQTRTSWVSFSANGNVLASAAAGSSDRSIKFWRLAADRRTWRPDDRLEKIVTAHGGGVTSIDFHPKMTTCCSRAVARRGGRKAKPA